MAKAEYLLSLIKAHFERQDERFSTLALQIAAHEARLKHGRLASEIQRLVDKSKASKFKSIRQEMPNDLQGLISETRPNAYLEDLIAPREVKDKIQRIVLEYVNRDKLHRNDLRNRRKVLLSGKPGTGKTFTASIIATELGLPLNTILTERLVTKYMGETSMKLRAVFDLIRSNPGVYLFDEFDAIGGERSRENDVGEMRRVLNSFLQFLEHDNSESLIIAITNNSSLLDQALFRRFDDVIAYNLPTDGEKLDLLKTRFSGIRSKLDYKKILPSINGLSHAEIVLACLDSIKESVLNDDAKLTSELVIRNMKDRNSAYRH